MPGPPRFSPTPAAGSLNPQHLARRDFKTRFRRKHPRFSAAARHQHIASRLARSAARDSIRTAHAAVGENRHLGRNQETKLAYNAVAAAMQALAARILADPVALDPQRVLVLERLNRSVPAIGHVGVRGAVAAGLR